MIKKRNIKGFTLIEMLIVVTIIGILAAIIIPRFTNTADTARRKAHLADRQHINSQIEMFYFNTGTYPSAMSNSGWNEPDGSGGFVADTYKKYFPEGVPTQCNRTQPWAIDTATERINPITNHTGHE